MSFAQAAARSNGAGTNLGRTFNGAATNITTHSACVDFFGNAPAMRGKGAQALILFQKAYAENREYALRTLLWLRDVRGGAGERQTFRSLLSWLSQTNVSDAAQIVLKTPEVGRWDDIFAAGGDARLFAFALADVALAKGDRLAAKWMPREGKPGADDFRKYLGLDPKSYRKLLARTSDTVEQKMCARQWDQINFSHVPSVAAKVYQKAFQKRATEAYAAYKAALKRNDGTAKVNASAIFPHDVLTGLKHGDEVVAEAQWKALPDYLGTDTNILPLIDLSGSMDCMLGGNTKGSVTCRDTALALGLYTAERQHGAFRNLVFTFSSETRVVQLSDSMSLRAKLDKVDDHYAGSTNIEAAFRKILEIAVRNGVPASDMPKTLLILSDTEFNQACYTGRQGMWGRDVQTTALDMLRTTYAQAGYAMPRIVFWNLNARLGNNPVTIRDDGTCLVGGYSPALFKAILAGKTFSPEDVMLNAIMSDRYKID